MNYELMLVVSTKAGLESVLSGVEKTLKEADGENIKVSKIGRKNLAYPISKHTEAEYVAVNFTANGESVLAVTNRLKAESEEILRFLLVKTKETKQRKQKAPVVAEDKVEVKSVPRVTVKTVTIKKEAAKDKAAANKTDKKEPKKVKSKETVSKKKVISKKK